ncbi:MAG TPA: T9SS type A sorting domain-containing protein [Bacteroidales bacterium]|jgi:hypothetical protein|nr:T9SS type A sorting domain-containing protein [Bacteroidales bacterium]HOS72519.1 T9SS type A sorting domain-containing protein [Bacteroidales bacterium]HPK06018.1 T9SS type A sorting domain-containing protein [Bacteroidales bacterium]HQH24363.1 T9SS type A sorting domain-containing protein [Bacteroidales bacterium]
MKQKLLKLSAMLLFCLGLTGLQAQESVNTTGGNASGSGGTVTYSVGQLVYQTHATQFGSMAHGVQQPYEISVVTGIEEAVGIKLSLSAYPNPTTDYLTLEVKDFDLSALYFYLYDMNGKLLQNEKIKSIQTNIDMSNLEPGSYFIKVIRKNKEFKTFKVIKN